MPDLNELERLLSAMKTGTREDEDRLLRWVFFHAPALIAQAREAARLREALLHIRERVPPIVTWWQKDPEASRDWRTWREGIDAALDPNRSE
jgi:hypothetical protein